LAAGLVGSNRLAVSALQSRQATRLALIYPLIVCCLAFVGLIGFCLFFLPVLQSTYSSMRIPVGTALQTLQSLRTTLPYWASAVPLAALAIVAWRIESRLHLQPLLQGTLQAVSEERSANFADAVATLLDTGLP